MNHFNGYNEWVEKKLLQQRIGRARELLEGINDFFYHSFLNHSLTNNRVIFINEKIDNLRIYLLALENGIKWGEH